MKRNQLILPLIALLLIVACHTTKKSTTAPVASAPVSITTSTVTTTTVNTAPAAGPSLPARSANGIYVPGNAELLAIQVKYPDVTLDKLKEGHAIYTTGACVNCHGANNIYRYTDSEWKIIMDDMALKALITNAQKDAVYKYVLSVREVQ